MTTLMLKDLEASQELDRRALAEIRGGDNGAVVGGQEFNDYSVIDIFSPNIVVKADTVLQLDNAINANILSPLAGILA
jgi:hypothetical protein